MFKGSKQEEVQRFTLGVRYKTSNYKLVKTPVDMVKINWKQKRTEAIQQPQYAVIPKSRVKKNKTEESEGLIGNYLIASCRERNAEMRNHS